MAGGKGIKVVPSLAASVRKQFRKILFDVIREIVRKCVHDAGSVADLVVEVCIPEAERLNGLLGEAKAPHEFSGIRKSH